MDLNCYADGYLKYYDRRGEKIYCAITRFHRKPRISAKTLNRATDAVFYGKRLVDRYHRLRCFAYAGDGLGLDEPAREPSPTEDKS